MATLRVLVAAVMLLAGTGVARAAPGDYKARRFDVVARVVGGDLEVTETITFEFQSGTFTKVWRDIPTARTDGIAILDAAMDDVRLMAGEGPGRFSVARRNGVRVEWRFDEAGPSVHRFTLRYQARGVAYREGGYDILRWRALPAEHRYAIDASRIQFEPSGADIVPPQTRRVDAVAARATGEGVTIDASGIRSNGWVIAELRYPSGALITGEPQWRMRDARAREMAPSWAIGGAAMLFAGVLLVLVRRQGGTPPAEAPRETAATAPPEPRPAALVAVLASRGGATSYQPMATMLDLADRGVLRVRETRGAFGTRAYELTKVPGRHDLAPHEAEALTIAFADHAQDVPLSKARGRLARRSRRFNAVVNRDLAALGLLDVDRRAARDRVTRTGLLLIVVAALGAAAVAPLVPRYLGWPFLAPLGLLVAGIVGVCVAASITPLSDRGLVEAARWRGFKRYLKSLARDGDRDAGVPSRWIVYAIAIGLAHHWARYLKRRPDLAPPWFLAAGPDSGRAFAAFVGGHAAANVGGAGGGVAAGGGGSGAG